MTGCSKFSCNYCRCRRSGNMNNSCCCPLFTCVNILSGVVYGIDGLPVENAVVSYETCDIVNSVTTDVNGKYIIFVPVNSDVKINVVPGIGVNVIPEKYCLTDVCGNITGLDFRFLLVSP